MCFYLRVIYMYVFVLVDRVARKTVYIRAKRMRTFTHCERVGCACAGSTAPLGETMRRALHCRCPVQIFLIGAVVFTLWIILLSLEQLRIDTDVGLYQQTPRKPPLSVSTYDKGAELQPLLLNNSVFLQALSTPQRPLLVRFDWYSRKITPVHIGYTCIIAGGLHVIRA